MKRIFCVFLSLLLLFGGTLPTYAVVSGDGPTVSVSLRDSDGQGLSGGKVSYCISSWASVGVTDGSGSLSFTVPEGTTAITVRMEYGGYRNDKKQDIQGNPEFDFRTQDTAVKLTDSNGLGLEGGKVRYSASSWADFAVTDSRGEAHRQLLPGAYTFRMEYAGARMDRKQDTAENPVVSFNTQDTVVKLTDSNGLGLEGGKVRYSASSWADFAVTDSRGEAHRQLLPGAYTFRMTYGGAWADIKQDTAVNATIDFKTVAATVRVTDGINGIENGKIRYSWASWFDFGQTGVSGEVTKELLPSAYTFRYYSASGYIDQKQDVGLNPLVLFHTEPTVARYQLKIGSTPVEGGTVTVSPLKRDYAPGEKVQVTPVPADGFIFSGWEGPDSGAVNGGLVDMNSSKSLTAVFVKTQGNVITVHTVQELMATESATKMGNITVLIADGDYVLPRGLYLTGSNLTYKSLSGNRDSVVLRGNFGISHIFQITNDNVTIQDLSIGQVNNHGIQIHSETDADNAAIRNVRFFDIREQMLKGSGAQTEVYSNDCIVEDCLFEFTGGKAYQYYTGGIDVHRGDGWVVRNNTFKNIISPVATLTEGAIHFWSGSRGTLVENNRIINCDRGILFGLDNAFHYGGWICNNTIHTVRDTGIYLANAEGARVYNNSVYIASSYPNAIEYRFAGTRDAEIANNLTNKAITQRDGGTASLVSNVTVAQSHWFADAAAGNLHLASWVSAVVDKATDLEGVTQDIDGDVRAPGRSDIGADERVGAPAPAIAALTLTASSLEVIADNRDSAELTVTAAYADGSTAVVVPDGFVCRSAQGLMVPMTGNGFKTWTPGVYALTALVGDSESNSVSITALEENLRLKQPTDLAVLHKAGQTFVTFGEVNRIIPEGAVTSKAFHEIRSAYPRDIRYNIYRSEQPITTLEGISPIGSVPALSCWDATFYGISSSTKDMPVYRYVIEDGAEPLDNGTGLFVHNPDNSGMSYYAVTAVIDGQENRALKGGNVLTAAVSETVGQGLPVLQRITHPDAFQYIRNPELRYYTRWESPPNCSVEGRPFDYLVALPPTRINPAPVGIHLHCWGGSLEGGYGWWNDAEDGAILMASNQEPYDWWTGYHEGLFTETPPKTQAQWQAGKVYPYTSTRLFSFLDWMKTQWAIDESRTFAAGSSMGGSGSLMNAIRYSDRIAWARSWVGVHVPEESPSFKSSYSNVYGKPEYNVSYADGTPVWDYYDDTWYLRSYPKKEIGFLTFSNGKNDSAIGWAQAVHFYEALQETKRPHLFVWGQSGHSQRTVMPLNGSERVMPIDIRIDQTLPAFTRCSLDDVPGNGDPSDGDPTGQINAYLYWETSDSVDTTQRWEMTVALTDKAPEATCTVDLTPRRCQQFKTVPGETVRWTNRDMGTGAVISSGTAVADNAGLVTLEGLTVGKGKNRIVIER